MDEKIALSLSVSEALVLYEWLAREEPSQHVSGAEQRVLWDIVQIGCAFAFGALGTACSVVKGIGYAMRGDWGSVAIEAASAVTGGLARHAVTAVGVMVISRKVMTSTPGAITRSTIRPTVRVVRVVRVVRASRCTDLDRC